ncbi:isochorismatase family protein [Reyranella soli]|uniref:Isochorismatase n=1 Tax=Reyranella soli TaxID=1230389 RepID=A0A512N8P7_9HYPH|nr:isochorismatase family protein [Reyranella soli]GEP55366.1 isochorismatase [Reyranella soli]
MPRDALVVVDMQVGLLDGLPKHDLADVVRRINAVAAFVRGQGGTVVWIRHCGKAGDGFARHEPGWAFLPELDRQPADLEIEKTLNDAFAGTALHETLQRLATECVVIAGWATDSCVDSTLRSAVSRDYHVVAVSDAHTLSDRPHLEAPAVIRHHNWVWSDLLTNRSIRVVTTDELLADQR